MWSIFLTHFFYFPCRLYASGAQPQVQKLYRPITYPVGRGTPMLNSLVKWDHSINWFLAKIGVESEFASPLGIEFFPPADINHFPSLLQNRQIGRNDHKVLGALKNKYPFRHAPLLTSFAHTAPFAKHFQPIGHNK